MKINKISLIIASSAILTSCGGMAPIVSTPISSANTFSPKTTPLTDSQTERWGAYDLSRDTIPGMSTDRAYSEIIKNQKGATVVVAVIDSGTDIEHEDLKNVLWTNKKEIPGNGVDDDKNGYIDDIHGWNFLGDIVSENMEYVRYIRTFGPKYEGKSESAVDPSDKEEFAMYQKAKAEFEKESQELLANKARYEGILSQLKPSHEAMTNKLGKEDYTKEDLAAIVSPNEQEQQYIPMLTQMLSFSDTIPEVITQLTSGLDYFNGRLESHFNTTKDFRAVLNDNPDDINDTVYGNNDVDGPTKDKDDVKHGTHVAGIIGAERNNGIGMDGVANNVEIMVVRAVPDGDEYDKDIALAIRYAVNNGAKVINTSFGKYYSPHPEWVWDAIKYADKKDVLIVNAAGNEGLNLDETLVYPNDQERTGAEIANNVLTVGALNTTYGPGMLASFSNYGVSNVDVFAPGVKIWATTPLDTYEYLQGTSMAAPAVAGAAAVIRSYFPKLSAKQVKQVLMNSGLSSKTKVILGGDKTNQEVFSTVSKSGNMVNLYNALIMASKI
jgi:subtilisin family serine protease